MDESESKKETHNGQNRRFSQEQYDMLKRCFDNRNMTEWNKWRKDHADEVIWLQGRDFKGWWLKKANLMHGTFFDSQTKREINYSGEVHLENSIFEKAHLEGCNLLAAHLQNTDFTRAKLQGADFSRAIVDGGTLIWTYEIDHKTKFEGVGLDAARIYPRTKQLLECNIRRMNWEEWYKWRDWFKYAPKEERKKRSQFFLKNTIGRFWEISDYGISTKRVIITFFALAFVFANIYYHWGRIAPPGIVENLFEVEKATGEVVVVPSWLVPLRTLYFSIVTMTTLGFGDMYANAQSIWGHILLSLQVILGYVLLGALVTRFAVLFTAGGPAGEFAKEN
jgi:hypothetical protein